MKVDLMFLEQLVPGLGGMNAQMQQDSMQGAFAAILKEALGEERLLESIAETETNYTDAQTVVGDLVDLLLSDQDGLVSEDEMNTNLVNQESVFSGELAAVMQQLQLMLETGKANITEAVIREANASPGNFLPKSEALLLKMALQAIALDGAEAKGEATVNPNSPLLNGGEKQVSSGPSSEADLLKNNLLLKNEAQGEVGSEQNSTKNRFTIEGALKDNAKATNNTYTNNSLEKAIDAEKAVIASKQASADAGFDKTSTNVSSRFEGSAKPANQVPLFGQDGVFQQPGVQGDEALQANKVVQQQGAATLRESVMQQLEGRLNYFRESGNLPAEMRLTLHPPELGEVTIRVFSSKGKLSASIIAESAVVKEILESSISELRQRLNFVNIQFEQLDFSTAGKETGAGSSGRSDSSLDYEFAAQRKDGSSVSDDEEGIGLSSEPPVGIESGIEYWA